MTDEKLILTTGPDTRDFYDEDTERHFIRGRPMEVPYSVLKSYAIKAAMRKGKLVALSGVIPDSCKPTPRDIAHNVVPLVVVRKSVKIKKGAKNHVGHIRRRN
jgi:hypothetical protein